MAKTQKIDFEQSLAELEALVETMEAGELSLEQSLTAFEKGMQLSRNCQRALAEAEQKVSILLEQDGKVQSADFQPGDSE